MVNRMGLIEADTEEELWDWVTHYWEEMREERTFDDWEHLIDSMPDRLARVLELEGQIFMESQRESEKKKEPTPFFPTLFFPSLPVLPFVPFSYGKCQCFWMWLHQPGTNEYPRWHPRTTLLLCF
jgi:hypothetical protein